MANSIKVVISGGLVPRLDNESQSRTLSGRKCDGCLNDVWKSDIRMKTRLFGIHYAVILPPKSRRYTMLGRYSRNPDSHRGGLIGVLRSATLFRLDSTTPTHSDISRSRCILPTLICLRSDKEKVMLLTMPSLPFSIQFLLRNKAKKSLRQPYIRPNISMDFERILKSRSRCIPRPHLPLNRSLQLESATLNNKRSKINPRCLQLENTRYQSEPSRTSKVSTIGSRLWQHSRIHRALPILME